jgi:membrane-associated phospholipid phosphatase
MRKIISSNKTFLILMSYLWILLALVLLIWSKQDIHIFINKVNNTFFDYFFKYATYLGDGLFVVLITVAFLFFSIRHFFVFTLSGVLGGILAQFFKRIIFPSALRPKALFNDIYELYLVPGVEMHSYHSFPSGHTTSAFALFLVLAYFAPKKWMKTACLFLAILVAYSRIYISQHFLIDVYFGGILGVISGLIGIYLLSKPTNKWLDKPIQKLF